MKNLEDLKRLNGLHNSFILDTKDYINYKLTIKYYIVWLFSAEKRWYEEVDLDKFELAKKEMYKNNNCENNIPYLLFTRYFVQPIGFLYPIEVSKELYDEINSWQTAEFYHDFYITRAYRDKNYDEYIEDIAIDNFNLEEKVIHNENIQNLINFAKKELTDTQFKTFYKVFIEGKSTIQTAREMGVSAPAISRFIFFIKKKFKKF